MNKRDCYECNLTPSSYCGECPVWLADEYVEQEERDAYKQGRIDALNDLVKALDFSEVFIGASDWAVDTREAAFNYVVYVIKNKIN